MIKKTLESIQLNLEGHNKKLKDMTPKEIILWGYKNFDNHFAITTSFGIQSSVILHMVHQYSLQKKIKIFWIDTGYLPSETYKYAERLINDLSLEIEVLQYIFHEINKKTNSNSWRRFWRYDSCCKFKAT